MQEAAQTIFEAQKTKASNLHFFGRNLTELKTSNIHQLNNGFSQKTPLIIHGMSYRFVLYDFSHCSSLISRAKKEWGLMEARSFRCCPRLEDPNSTEHLSANVA